MLDREAMPFKIDVVAEFLSSDNAPHSIKEISTALNIPFNECENIARFLVKYDFAQFEDKGFKIDQKTRDFIFATLNEPLLQTTLPR
jgi:predicted transcriptional regulator